MRYDGGKRSSTWNIGRSVQILTAALFLLALTGFPPTAGAQESVTYTWTAPTTGGAVDGYQARVKRGAGPWQVLADSLAVRSVTYTQPAGSVDQLQVYAFNHRLEAILDGNGQLIGQRSVRQYGQGSPYGVPNVTDVNAPGGCGRPVRQ